MTPAERTVLLVEDDALLRQAFRLLLEDSGYDVREAGSAASALRSAEESTPSAVVLDMGLPDRPGLDVARELRQQDATRDVPIIALTGRVGPEEKRACIEAGCTEYHGKPLAPRLLLERLAALLAS